MMMQQIQRANAPNPQLEALKGFHKRILDWHLNPTNTVKDIAKHPTIGSKMPTYQLAKTYRDKGRIAKGVASLGGRNDASYAKDLDMEQQFERGITSAGMLEQGLQGEMDSAASNLMSLEGMDISRMTSSNSLMQYLHQDVGRRMQQGGGWGGFFRGLLGGLSGLAGGMGI